MDINMVFSLEEKEKHQLQKIISCNEFTEVFGVTLSENEVKLLLEERKNHLKEQERVEFGEGILSKLIHAFCDSPYVYQSNYVDTIGALQAIFYQYKNEIPDEVTDDELLEFMVSYFNKECQGSLEYLEETYLEMFARSMKR